MKYCCDKMDRWSKPNDDAPYPLILRTKLGTMVGIHINDGGNSLVSMAHCPWCGVKVSEVEESLIGKRMVEVV